MENFENLNKKYDFILKQDFEKKLKLKFDLALQKINWVTFRETLNNGKTIVQIDHSGKIP